MSSTLHIPGIDVPEALDRLGGNTDLLLKYLRLLCTHAMAQLDTLTQHLEAHDAQQAQALLHSLKGSAASLSVVQLHALCQQAELHCKALHWPALLQCCTDIRQYLNTLSAHCNTTPPLLGNQ